MAIFSFYRVVSNESNVLCIVKLFESIIWYHFFVYVNVTLNAFIIINCAFIRRQVQWASIEWFSIRENCKQLQIQWENWYFHATPNSNAERLDCIPWIDYRIPTPSVSFALLNWMLLFWFALFPHLRNAAEINCHFPHYSPDDEQLIQKYRTLGGRFYALFFPTSQKEECDSRWLCNFVKQNRARFKCISHHIFCFLNIIFSHLLVVFLLLGDFFFIHFT